MKYLRVILIVLLLGCCTLWVASYWGIQWVSSDGHFAIGLVTGGFLIERHVVDTGLYGLSIYGYTSLHTNWWPVVWIYNNPEHWVLRGTFWLPTLLLSLPLAFSTYSRARRRWRAKQGLCLGCGYDLSGTDHTLCSECGTKREPLVEQSETFR